MINILLVDDSPTQLMLLRQLFEAEADLHIVGCAKNGQEAVELTALLKPDLITMDIHMPVMDGLEATRLIMMRNPTPIVIISSTVQDETLNTTFKALEAGAVSVLEKPTDIFLPAFRSKRTKMIDTIRTMSEIKIIKRRFFTKPVVGEKAVITPDKLDINRHYELVAFGASVGGPQTLKTILASLPKDFPVPIVVVQHMTLGFTSGFVQWLNENVTLTVKEARSQEILQAGVVYFAPDNYHLEVGRQQGNLIAKLSKSPPISGFRPSVTALLSSVAKTCGKNAIGIILTGMGNDGAQGLLEMKQAHAHTLIQDPQSAVVFGMPGVAQSLGAVDKVIPLDKISTYITALTLNPSSRSSSG